MFKSGWLKQALEVATKEVKSRPSWMQNLREVEREKVQEKKTGRVMDFSEKKTYNTEAKKGKD